MESKNRRAFAAPCTAGTAPRNARVDLKARSPRKNYIGRPALATPSGMAKAVTKSLGFEARTKTSRAYAERARKSLPGGVTANVKYFDPYPIAMTRARGDHARGAGGAGVPPAADGREVRGALPRRRRRVPREPRAVEVGDGSRTPTRGGIARNAGPRARGHACAPLQRSRRDGGADSWSRGSPRLRHYGASRAIVHRARSGLP